MHPGFQQPYQQPYQQFECEQMDDEIQADGLDALRRELDLTQIMRLIERTARWVDPATFRLLPLWYPEYARGTYLYNADWSAPRMNINRQTKESTRKREGNGSANKALTSALGLRSDDRPNWSCCHIWGVDDDKYQVANVVIQDRRYFSCIANMVLLPSPLKAFTDVMIEVKAMLRICARNLYGWHCDHENFRPPWRSSMGGRIGMPTPPAGQGI